MSGVDAVRWNLGIAASAIGVILAVIGLYELVRAKPPVSAAATVHDFSGGIHLDLRRQG